ncbi:hypothetical protein QO001_006398 [Methylobacterium brachiatum]|uniref:Uncharacterized protein n=1 Tax=Methylobacterium brachiatum TaxID=269660 RepID=A0AAJ1WYB0_9HYPH|nr:hypothetical protein [Methylobacterium brachiatum]
MVNLQPALQEEHLLDVAIAERVAQVPGNSLDDQRALEVSAPEITLDLSLQLEGEGVEDQGATERSGKLGGYG